MKKINNGEMKDRQRILHFIASIITIFNFIIAIQISPSWSEIFSSQIGNMALAFRIVIFLFLGCALAYTFGLLIVLCYAKIPPGKSRFIVLMVMGMISAGVSFYNMLNFLIVESIHNLAIISLPVGWLILFIPAIVALILARIFIMVRAFEIASKYNLNHTTFVIIGGPHMCNLQSICFLIIYIAVII